MKITKKVNLTNSQNTYILTSENEAAVIDPGIDADEIINICGKNIKYIILTHCHYDHIEGLKDLKEKTGARIVFSKTAKENLNNPDINLSGFVYGRNTGTVPDITVEENDILNLGNEHILCIETPGHTSCGMCYITGDNLFSGDTLFENSIGRTDFPTGNYNILKESIKNKIYTLPENVKIYPGHGEETSVEKEKKYNSFIRG